MDDSRWIIPDGLIREERSAWIHLDGYVCVKKSGWIDAGFDRTGLTRFK